MEKLEYRLKDNCYLDQLKSALSNKYVISTIGAVAATGLVASVLDSNTAYAAADMINNLRMHGFLDGVVDGLLFPVNALVSLFGDSAHTFARDGTGISSEPNNFSYWLGYLFMAGPEATLLGGISSMTPSSRSSSF